MVKDFVISEWDAAAYGDVWHNFGGIGSKWTVGNTLINMLQDNNDPRLSFYANPAVGGSFVFSNDATTPDPNFQTRVDFVIASLDAAGADYTVTVNGTDTTIEVPGGQYIGLPTRVNGDIMPYIRYEMYSLPGEMVTQQKGSQVNAYPEIVLTSAEAYFLQAEAVVKGLDGASGDPQELFAAGIREAMKIWGVPSGDAETYITNEAAADITLGTVDEKLEKIAHQRWLASYTDGFEAWAVVRDTGYPASLAVGVSDPIIYELGTLNGAYPQRLRYGSGAQDNPNFSAVEGVQGANVQATKLWFAK